MKHGLVGMSRNAPRLRFCSSRPPSLAVAARSGRGGCFGAVRTSKRREIGSAGQTAYLSLEVDQAAVDEQFGAGGVGGIGGEVDGCGGDFGGGAGTAERNAGFGPLDEAVLLSRCKAAFVEDWGDDRTGTNGVDPYAARRQLLSNGAAERTQRRLGRAVDCAASQAAVRARHRSGQDDRAAVRNDRNGVLDQEECALDVDVELAVVKGLIDLRDRRELGDAGVDEQDVDAALFGLDLVDQDLGSGHVAGIRDQHLDAGQRRLGGFYRAFARAGNDYLRAFGLKEFGGLRTDSAGAAADESDLAVELGHERFPDWSGLLCPRDGGPPWREQWLRLRLCLGPSAFQCLFEEVSASKSLRFFASPFASAFRPPPRLPVAAGDRIIRPQLAAPLAPTTNSAGTALSSGGGGKADLVLKCLFVRV